MNFLWINFLKTFPYLWARGGNTAGSAGSVWCKSPPDTQSRSQWRGKPFTEDRILCSNWPRTLLIVLLLDLFWRTNIKRILPFPCNETWDPPRCCCPHRSLSCIYRSPENYSRSPEGLRPWWIGSASAQRNIPDLIREPSSFLSVLVCWTFPVHRSGWFGTFLVELLGNIGHWDRLSELR